MCLHRLLSSSFFFFLNDPPPPEISPLPLHDALPILGARPAVVPDERMPRHGGTDDPSHPVGGWIDRKSTRLNSSHSQISYAVFCLKKKKRKEAPDTLSISILTDLVNRRFVCQLPTFI